MQTLAYPALIAVLFLSFGILVSCGDDDDDNDDDDDDDDNDYDAADDDNDDDSGETWTDPSSGLTWQVTPSSKPKEWAEAKSYCYDLSLDGGGWHLPTISELRTLIRGCDATVTGGSCGVTDDCLDSSCHDNSCNSCNWGDGPNNGAYDPSELSSQSWSWSSSPVADYSNGAWYVDFSIGIVNAHYGVHQGPARCVRE